MAGERLALRLERGSASGEAVVRASEAAAAQARLVTGLARCGAAILAKARAKAAVAMDRRWAAKSAGR